MSGFEPLHFEPYMEEHTAAVADFNRRIQAANPPFLLPDTPAPGWIPRCGNRKIYQEIFLAIEDGRVRGGYTLKHQEFSFRGRILDAAACQMPISEGIVDRRCGFIGPRLLRDALRRRPLLFGLGIGSLDASVTRIEQALGWRVQVIPFFYRVRNGFNFFRNIEYLKTTRWRRWSLDATAYSGLGWAGARVARAVLPRPNGVRAGISAEQPPEFSGWADELWETCRGCYSMAAVRDAEVLNVLYPPDSRFIRVKVLERGHPIGWAVLLDTRMDRNKYFGNMRIGSIVDCLALPQHASKVIAAAADVLDRRGVDLLVSNQSHAAWGNALRKSGFLEGPSNFILTTSKPLWRLLDEIDPGGTSVHMNRGDGDGPIHL